TDLPLIRDPNSPEGRREILDRLRARLAEAGKKSEEVAKEAAEADDLLSETQIYAFRARAGDDASCLNLYQPRNPRVLGAPAGFIASGGFVFDDTLAQTDEEKGNPWTILLRKEGLPAFGEKNTVQWMLKR